MRTTMRLATATFVTTFSLTGCALLPIGPEETETSTKVLTASRARITNTTGAITLKTWERPEIEVTAIKKTRMPRHFLQGVHPDVTLDGDTVVVNTRYDGPLLNVSVEYQIQAPASLAVESVTSTTGMITASGMQGDTRFETTTGGIRVDRWHGTIDAKTTTGEITLTGVTGINQVESTTGAVVADVRGLGATPRVTTTVGAVTLGIAPGMNLQLEANTSIGGISNALPLTNTTLMPNRLTGTLGQGGPTLKVVTSVGSITLR